MQEELSFSMGLGHYEEAIASAHRGCFEDIISLVTGEPGVRIATGLRARAAVPEL